MTPTTPVRSRHSNERASWPARARRGSLLAAVALLTCAVVLLVGWLVDLRAVVGLGAGEAATPPCTAVGCGLLAAGLLLRPGSRGRQLCYGVVLLVGAAVLAESETTAIGLVVLALGGLLSEFGRRSMAQVMAATAGLLGLTACLGYLYGVDDLYQVGESSSMSVATAVCIVVAALTIWLTVAHGILQWLAFGTDSGARLLRVFTPVALLLIPAAAWLYVNGLEAGVYGIGFGTALMTSFAALVIVAVGYRTGRTAFLMDRERDTLLDELHRVNSELEDRVRVKVQQLNRQKTKLALFEERDRIARDLHDRVIQRIFAAGLQVAALGRIARKEAAAREGDSAVADSLDLVAMELDLAIRELRNSIFELTSIGDHDNLEQVVRDIAARAARILGFMPRVDVHGQVAGVGADLVAQLASVIQEGLSNVARHAHASAVEVAVVGTDDHLQVRITDDGVGLPEPLPRSSGINNLMNRARQLGGTATWSAGEQGGTVLVWQVPCAGRPASEPRVASMT